MLKPRTVFFLLFALNLTFIPLFIHTNWQQHKIASNVQENDTFYIHEVDTTMDSSSSSHEGSVISGTYIKKTEDNDSGMIFLLQDSLNGKKNLSNKTILELLGAYPPLTEKYLNTYPARKVYYDVPDHGLYNDGDYCTKVDLYNIANPESLFEQMNFFTDYMDEEMGRSVIQLIGNDTMPQIDIHMNKSEYLSRKYHLDATITTYFTKKVDVHLYHEIGKHFLCVTQMYNHIPGHGVFKRKDLIVGTIKRYSKEFYKRPHCFNKDKFFPLSYRLYDKKECHAFFKIITSPRYERSLERDPIQYLLKIGVGSHKASGVTILDANATANLLEKYENGTSCGKILESYVAQTYIANPLLLDRNNKFDFRIYMLVASTNPLIVYFHDGFLRVSLSSYNKSSNDKGTHLTNTYLSMKKLQEIPDGENTTKTINGMTEEEAKKYVLWKFDQLQKYLLESKKVKDPRWLDNTLRPAFRKAFVHVARMSREALWPESNVFELFGLDFMLDNKLNLWLLECNSSPQLLEDNGKEFMTKMLVDMFKIQYSYYRSRMKRMLDVLQRLQAERAQKGEEGLDLTKWRNEYQKAMRNRLEPEYELSKTNSWKIAMDENLPGAAAYFGHIANECA